MRARAPCPASAAALPAASGPRCRCDGDRAGCRRRRSRWHLRSGRAAMPSRRLRTRWPVDRAPRLRFAGALTAGDGTFLEPLRWRGPRRRAYDSGMRPLPLLVCCSLLAAQEAPKTTPEATDYQRTSTCAEVATFLQALPKLAHGERLQIASPGKSHGGHELELVRCALPGVDEQ